MSARFYQDFSTLAPHWPGMRRPHQRIVFTNGCFDILHAGHVAYLEEARNLGDYLILGLNSDHSIARLKGSKRPIVPFADRAYLLSGLAAVDCVVGFEEDTPYDLIKQVAPHILVKGGDWKPEDIVGSDLVLAAGGEVRSLQLVQGRSTTNVVDTILTRYQHEHP